MLDTNHSGGILAALGTVRANLETIARLRREPGDPELSPLFLKHSDEQTIVGLVAVLRAITSGNLAGEDFSQWGIVAAPQRLGRAAVAEVFDRFARRGAGSASPLVIPHRSLHSVSGTISEALGIHGPNLSVSGGPGNLAEGLLAALTFLNDNRLPGIWAVLTQWDPEPALPVAAGDQAICQAQAFALMPASSGRVGPRLRLLRPAEMPSLAQCLPLPELADLHEVFTRAGCQRFGFEWGGGIEVASRWAVPEVLAEIEA